MRSTREIGRGLALLVVALGLAAGCEERDDLDGRRRPIPGLQERAPEHAIPIGDSRIAYDFFDNRAAAVVHAAGDLLVDPGTADLVKYAEGLYRSPWHLGVGVDQGTLRTALVDGLAGELYLPIDRDPGGVARTASGGVRITLRARAAAEGQLVSVFLNEQRLGEISMPTTGWKEYAIDAPAKVVRDGENKLRFYFRHAGEIAGRRTAAAISRIAVGDGGAGISAQARFGPVTRDGKALSAVSLDGPGRISYYVRVPRREPALVLAAGGDGELAVRVAGTASGASAEVWRADATAGWADARVSLADFAGEVVRIDFIGAGDAAWGRPRLVAGPEDDDADAERRPADHVIVWVVSSLRADRLGGAAVPTPGFARLGDRGVTFLRASTAAPAPGPAHAAMLTGRFPDGPAVPEGIETLAERFRAAGYATALLSGNGFVHDGAGFARGFDLYDNPMRRSHPHGARHLWQQAERFLRRHADGRTLLYLATVEPHLPYTPTAENLAREWTRQGRPFDPARTAAISEAVAARRQHLGAEERAFVEALYDAEVRDADEAFATMLDTLDQLELTDRTAIILVADHGQELFERGAFGHGSHLHREVVRVPLVVAGPGLPRGTTSEAAVSGIDLYATALDLGGIAPNPTNQGLSALPAARGRDPLMPRPVFAHLPGRGRSLELGRYKLIVPIHGPHLLYDLEADPNEERNLMGERPLVERYLRTVFGIGTAYRNAWNATRWGTAGNHKAAFAADQGL